MSPHSASHNQPFPWAAAMHFGLGRLRLSSHDFWAMSPFELAAAAHGFNGVGTPSLSLTLLQEMMRQYPDVVDFEVKQ